METGFVRHRPSDVYRLLVHYKTSRKNRNTCSLIGWLRPVLHIPGWVRHSDEGSLLRSDLLSLPLGDSLPGPNPRPRFQVSALEYSVLEKLFVV